MISLAFAVWLVCALTAVFTAALYFPERLRQRRLAWEAEQRGAQPADTAPTGVTGAAGGDVRSA